MTTPQLSEIVDVPHAAYVMTGAELGAWGRTPHHSTFSVVVHVDPCVDRFGHAFAGYILPENVESSAYVSGWFAGRRSARK